MNDIEFNKLTTAPYDVYCADKVHLTRSRLLDFIKSPALYNMNLKYDDSSNRVIRRAAHVRCLEGRAAYEQVYAVGGPVNPGTGKPYGTTSKAFIDWAALQVKQILSEEQDAMIERMATGFDYRMVDEAIAAPGKCGVVVRGDYYGVLCQTQIDWLNQEYGIMEFETCDDLDDFQYAVKRGNYLIKYAFTRGLIEQQVGVSVPITVVAVEKRAPFRCGVWMITNSSIDRAEERIVNALEALGDCQTANKWPTGYEKIYGVLRYE